MHAKYLNTKNEPKCNFNFVIGIAEYCRIYYINLRVIHHESWKFYWKYDSRSSAATQPNINQWFLMWRESLLYYYCIKLFVCLFVCSVPNIGQHKQSNPLMHALKPLCWQYCHSSYYFFLCLSFFYLSWFWKLLVLLLVICLLILEIVHLYHDNNQKTNAFVCSNGKCILLFL